MAYIIASKVLRFYLAWFIGSGLYFFLAMATVYDGFPSIIGQSIVAIIISAVLSLISVIIGLPFMVFSSNRSKRHSMIIGGLGLFVGFIFFMFPELLLPIFQCLVPVFQNYIVEPVFIPVYFGYFIIIFTIANWPKMNIIRHKEGTEPWLP